MPGSTANGFPFAEPTDPLVQWPSTSQALAEKLDNSLTGMKFATGVIQHSGLMSGDIVQLPAGQFTAPPSILLSANDEINVFVSASAITTEQFRVSCTNSDATGSTPARITWFAIGS